MWIFLYTQNTFAGTIEKVWLPRQDQLQILSGLSWQEFDKECLKYDAETKEQAGIQAVMKEKYNKVWDGERWIKELLPLSE